MALSQPDLWSAILNHVLPHRAQFDVTAEPPRNMTSFEDCLRREGDWTDTAANQITMEYRKFLYLKAVQGGVLTPSEVVDQAWHLHRCFPEAYRRFCAEVAGQDIPHQRGIPKAQADSSYARLLAAYVREFDQTPSVEIWPSLAMLRREEQSLRVMQVSLLVATTSVPLAALSVHWFGSAHGWLLTGWFLILGAGVLAGLIGVARSSASPATIARCG